MDIPETSRSLLRSLSMDSQSCRWKEFVDRYRPMMEGYLRARYSSIEVEDIIQEALFALSRALPNYRYDPEELGSFHDYIAAVLRNKACDSLRRKASRKKIAESFLNDPTNMSFANDTSYDIKRAVMSIALRQVLNDSSVLERTRRVFVETAINGKSPDEVADMFGITRNNVDQIKARMIKRIQDVCLRLQEVAGGL